MTVLSLTTFDCDTVPSSADSVTVEGKGHVEPYTMPPDEVGLSDCDVSLAAEVEYVLALAVGEGSTEKPSDTSIDVHGSGSAA